MEPMEGREMLSGGSKPAALDPPARLEVVFASATQVQLRWRLKEHGGASRTLVSRSMDGKKWGRVAVVRGARWEFVDQGVRAGRQYRYRVRAYDGDRRSPFSKLVRVGARVAAPSREAVAAAIAHPLIRYGRNIAGGAHTDQPSAGGAPVVLALAAMAGNRSADERLLEQIRFTLTAGNEITANGGYPAQHERHVTGMFALVRSTPRIWKQLTDIERAKIDLLMKAALVASAFTTSDSNAFIAARAQERALDGDSNLSRQWNPNYREGMVGGMLVGMVYFGGPVPASRVLEEFDHGAFVGQLKSMGMVNLHQTFDWKRAHPESGAPSGGMIEGAIREYRYLGLRLAEYMRIYGALAAHTFGAMVEPGRIVNGAADLPNVGKPGMLLEFDGRDAHGVRSSAAYAHDGFRTHLINQLVLVAGGYWNANAPAARDAVKRMNIGAEDLWYKLDRGYWDYSKGKQGAVVLATDSGRGFEFTRPMWDVVKAYHRGEGSN